MSPDFEQRTRIAALAHRDLEPVAFRFKQDNPELAREQVRQRDDRDRRCLGQRRRRDHQITAAHFLCLPGGTMGWIVIVELWTSGTITWGAGSGSGVLPGKAIGGTGGSAPIYS